MNLRPRKKFNAEVYISSFNDIMFFLMLFFLIASTLVSPSVIKLTLPKSKYNQSVRKTEISLSITRDLKYYIDNKQVTFNDLESDLEGYIRNLKQPTVVIRCDNAIPVQKLVDVMQIGSKLKLKMILATKSPNG